MSRHPMIVVLAITWLFFAAAPSAQAVLSYSESNGMLYTIDPETGDVQEIGPTGVEHSFFDLVFDTGGRLYGIGGNTGLPDALFQLDPQTGTAMLIGELGIDLGQLAIDGNGRFWASDGDQLFSIDPSTGTATPGPVLEEPAGVLAAFGDHLYSVRQRPDDQIQIDRVDTTTGTFTHVFVGGEIPQLILNASFDAGGDLWLNATVPGPLIPVVSYFYYRIDPIAGTVELTLETGFSFFDPHAWIFAVAIEGGPLPLAIPTLGPLGIVGLALLLAATDLALARRRARIGG